MKNIKVYALALSLSLSFLLTGCFSADGKLEVGEATNLFDEDTELKYSSKYGRCYYKIFQFLNEEANPDYYIVQLMNIDIESGKFFMVMNSFAIPKTYDIDKDSSIVADVANCEWRELTVNGEPMEVQVLDEIEILTGE